MALTWGHFFQPPSCGLAGHGNGQTTLLFTKPDFVNAIRLSTQHYFNLNNVSAVSFLYPTP
jgi:hypothetical protein